MTNRAVAPLLLAGMALAACGSSGTPSNGDAGGGLDVAQPELDGTAPDSGMDAGADTSPPEASEAEVADSAEAAPADADAAAVTPGHALSFASQGPQYVSVPDTAKLDLTSQFTYEWWLKVASGSGIAALIGKPFGHQNGDTTAVWFEAGSLHAAVNANSTSGAISYTWPSANNGIWHHIAWTYDDTTKSQILYVDGVSVAMGTNILGTPTYDSHPFLIGADINYDTLGYGIDGTIDDVRIFSAVRTPAQIASDMAGVSPVGDAALVAYFTFDEGSGSTAHDSSANHLDGALGAPDAGASAPTWVTSTAPF